MPTTLELLQRIQVAPKNVVRRSTRKKLFFMQYQPIFSLTEEMRDEFISTLKSIDSENDPAVKSLKRDIKAQQYNSVLDFLALSGCEKTPAVTQFVLSAAVKIINDHPASIWHEFVILQNLENIFDFSVVPEYLSQLNEKKSEIFYTIIKIQHILEKKEENYMLRALNFLPIASLDQKKVALFTLICHHLLKESFHNSRFNEKKHLEKCKHANEVLLSIKELPGSIRYIEPEIVAQEFYGTTSDDLRIQEMTLFIHSRLLVLRQPKMLSSELKQLLKAISAIAFVDALIPESGVKRFSESAAGTMMPTGKRRRGESAVLATIEEEKSDSEASPQKLPVEKQVTGSRDANMASLAYYHEGDDESVYDDNSSVAESYIADQDDVYEDEFLPSQSGFANKFLHNMRSYYSGMTEDIKVQAIHHLINDTLAMNDNITKLGARVNAPKALAALRKYQETAGVAFDVVYRNLCIVLQAIVFLKCSNKVKDSTISFCLDASATLIQLRQQALSSSGLPAYSEMLEQRYDNGLSIIECLLYRQKRPDIELYRSPFIWGKWYNATEENIETQYTLEFLGTNLLVGILQKAPGTLTIHEQGLVVMAVMNYERRNRVGDKETKTPFYNIMRSLAVSYQHITFGQSESAVAILSDDIARENAVTFCRELYQRAVPLMRDNLDDLTEQERVIYDMIQTEIASLKPQKNVSSDTWETESMASQQSKRSTSSRGSRSSQSSTASRYSRSKSGRENLSKDIFDVGFIAVWNSMCQSEAPLDKTSVKCILKNFTLARQRPELNATEAYVLLNRAFNWLSLLPSTTREISIKGTSSFYGKRKKLHFEDIASSNWNTLTSGMYYDNAEEVIAKFCIYLMRNEERRSYELRFLMKGLGYLLSYQSQLAQELKNLEAELCSDFPRDDAESQKATKELEIHEVEEGLNFIAELWEKSLAESEEKARKGKLEEADVELYREILSEGGASLMAIPSIKPGETSYTERVSDLLEKVKPETANRKMFGTRK